METNLAYREEPREEIIGGSPVMMAPPTTRHTRTQLNLSRIFGNYLHGKACDYFPETGLYLQEAEEEYIPDGMVVCQAEKVQEDGVHGAPDLVIEVLSRSTARYDRGRKKDAYEAAGVKEYWIVVPELKLIEQYILEGGHFTLRDVYALIPEVEFKRLSPQRREEVRREFRCSLYDDLIIRLEDVFYRVP